MDEIHKRRFEAIEKRDKRRKLLTDLVTEQLENFAKRKDITQHFSKDLNTLDVPFHLLPASENLGDLMTNYSGESVTVNEDKVAVEGTGLTVKFAEDSEEFVT